MDRIEHFKWDDEQNSLYFPLYFTRFERLMRLQRIIVAEAETDPDINTIVIDSLITVGGNELCRRIMEVDDYETLTYGRLKAELEKAYMCNNVKLNEFKFRKVTPEPEEKLKDYVRRLKAAAHLAAITDEKTILMQILLTTNSEKIRSKIMGKSCTLQSLLDYQETHDIVTNDMTNESIETAKINMISSKPHSQAQAHAAFGKQQRNEYQNQNQKNVYTASNNNQVAVRITGLCFYCNLAYPHDNGICPAANERCEHCNKLGHRLICCFQRMQLILANQNQLKENRTNRYNNNAFKAQIQTSNKPTNNNPHQAIANKQSKHHSHQPNQSQEKAKNNQPTTNSKPIHKAKSIKQIQETESEEYACDDEDCPECNNGIQQIKQVTHKKRKRPIIEVKLNETRTNMLLDTGADLNAISSTTYNTLIIKPRLLHSLVRFTPFGSIKSQETMGYFNTCVKLNNIRSKIKIFVIDDTETKVDNILCFETLLLFKLITVNIDTINSVRSSNTSLEQTRKEFTQRMKNKYPRVWQDRIGLIPNLFVHVEVNDAIEPCQQVPYELAYSLIPGSEKKLDYLDKQGVTRSIKPGSHTGWISPIRVVPKDGVDEDGHQKVRVTINSIKLNQAVIKKKRLMPNTKSIMRQLNGKKYFTKLDIKDAFHTIALDEESQKYTVFSTNTHGLKIQTRLWMGLCISSEIYHEVMEAKLQGLNDIAHAIDDIMVASTTIEECMINTEAAIARLDELNLTISDKCKFLQTEIDFWG
jgi:hypothetical protein